MPTSTIMQIYTAETPPPPPESEQTREVRGAARPARPPVLQGGLSTLTRLILDCWGNPVTQSDSQTVTITTFYIIGTRLAWPGLAGCCWRIKYQIRSVISASPPLELAADAEVSFIMKSACFAYTYYILWISCKTFYCLDIFNILFYWENLFFTENILENIATKRNI